MLVLDSKMYLESAYIQAVASLAKVYIAFRENGDRINLTHFKEGYNIALVKEEDVEDLKMLILRSFKTILSESERNIIERVAKSDMNMIDRLHIVNILLSYAYENKKQWLG